jgi:drug/metabolite transporter (DMT)-like permease
VDARPAEPEPRPRLPHSTGWYCPGVTSLPGPASTQKKARDLGVLALMVLAPIWGYGWVAGKIAVGYSPAMTFSAMRTALGAACLLLVLALTRRSFRPPPLVYTAVIGLLQTTAFVGLNTIGLAGAGAGKVAVLTYTMPFWLLLLAWTFLGERLRGLQWAAVLLAFAGLLLVVSPWTLEGLWPSLVTVLGGLAWAGSALVVKLMQRTHPHVDVLSLTTWQMTIGCIPLILLAVATQSGWPQWTAGYIFGLTYTVVLANAVAWVLWLYALHRLSAGEAGLGTLVIPVLGVVLSWVQLGEVPSKWEAIGGPLIIGGLALLAAHGLRAGRHGPAAPAGESSVAEEPAVQPITD